MWPCTGEGQFNLVQEWLCEALLWEAPSWIVAGQNLLGRTTGSWD
jgi:hypothetical protein